MSTYGFYLFSQFPLFYGRGCGSEQVALWYLQEGVKPWQDEIQVGWAVVFHHLEEIPLIPLKQLFFETCPCSTFCHLSIIGLDWKLQKKKKSNDTLMILLMSSVSHSCWSVTSLWLSCFISSTSLTYPFPLIPVFHIGPNLNWETEPILHVLFSSAMKIKGCVYTAITCCHLKNIRGNLWYTLKYSCFDKFVVLLEASISH